ncbi:MAG TPA: hypothetical protein VGD55_09490, partial [Acidothermaceae bacterium]
SEPGQFITWGYYDQYVTDELCEFLRIDGVPDGTYDLVVEENTDRLINCDGTESSCHFDGRLDDNVVAMRITIAGSQVSFPAPSLEGGATGLGPFEMLGAPAVVTHAIDTYDLYYVASDHGLYTLHQNASGVWTGAGGGSSDAGSLVFNPSAAGYPMTGTIAAVVVDNRALATPTIRTDVFGGATTGDLLRFSITGSGLQVFQYGVAGQGYGIAGTAAVVDSSAKNAIAVWTTPQGAVAFGSYSGTDWLPPRLVSAPFVAASQTPGLTSSGDGMFHLFIKDSSGNAWYDQYVNGAWGTWQQLSTGAVAPWQGNLAAVSSYMRSADVFATTTDHRVFRNTWTETDAGQGFSGWSDPLAGNNADRRVGSSLTAVSTGTRKKDVFFYDAISPTMLWQLHYDETVTGPQPPALPWTLRNLSKILVVQPMWPVVVGSWADNTFDLFQKFTDARIGVRRQR